MKQDTIINVGLIGFGNAGRLYHAPFLNSVPGFRLAKVRTTRAVVGQALSALPVHTQIVTDNDAILQDASIDLVVIAAPNHLHFPLAKAALEAGKHVVVDKPFTLSTAGAELLVQPQEARDVIYLIELAEQSSREKRTLPVQPRTALQPAAAQEQAG